MLDLSTKRKTIDLRRNDTNNTAPAKSDSATIEKAHIKTICTSLNFRENFCIMF